MHSFGTQEHLEIAALQACKNIPPQEILLALNYSNNPLKWSALNYAIEMRDYQAAILIADFTKDLNRRESAYPTNLKSQHKINALERVLHIAQFREKQKTLSEDQQKLIAKLIEKGIDIDHSSNTNLQYPLFYFCYFNEIEFVNKLLDRGVDINKNNGYALSVALCCGHTELVHYLIDRGADFHLIDMLHDAILSQKCPLVQLALDYGFDITSLDAVDIAINYTWGEIRLLETQCGSLPAVEMVYFLLANGANPNYWVAEAQTNNMNILSSFRFSPLGKALNLLDTPPNPIQEWYQKFLIDMLLDFGAAPPV